MLGSRHGYAWRVAAYVCPVIAISGGSVDGANDFLTALERLLENLLGISSITLIALLAGARESLESFKQYINELSRESTAIVQSASHYCFKSDDPAAWADLKQRLNTLKTLLARFELILQPAIDEDYSTGAHRSRWRSIHQHYSKLGKEITAWCISLRHINSWRATQALEAHLDRAQLALQPIADPSRPSATAEDQNNSNSKDPEPFLSLANVQLERLRERSIKIADLLRQTNADPRQLAPHTTRVARPWVLDLDRLRVGFRLTAGIWIAVLAWIFIPDLPGGAAVITLTAVFSAVLALAGMRSQQLLPAVMRALVPAGLLYVLVLPHLEGFAQLATVLFAFVVTVFVLSGKQASVRTLSVDFLLITFGITNQQSYSIICFINRAIAITIACGIIALLQEFPWSSNPNAQLLDYLSRFRTAFRHAMGDVLLQRQKRSAIGRLWNEQSARFYWRELSILPSSIENLLRKHAHHITISPITIDALSDDAMVLSSLALELRQRHEKLKASQMALPAPHGRIAVLSDVHLGQHLKMLEDASTENDPILATIARNLTEAWDRLPDATALDSHRHMPDA